MHSSGSITSMRSISWMQSTGQTLWHEMSFTSTHASPMMYVTVRTLLRSDGSHARARLAEPQRDLEILRRDGDTVLTGPDRADGDLLDRPALQGAQRLVQLTRRLGDLLAE